MSQPIADMVNAIARATASCPKVASTAELFRYVVVALTNESAAEPRTTKVMQIALRHPAARDAMVSRIATTQTQIEEAFRRRCKDVLTVQVLSSLTISALSLTTRHWFENGQKDIAVSARKIFSTIADIACGPDAPPPCR